MHALGCLCVHRGERPQPVRADTPGLVQYPEYNDVLPPQAQERAQPGHGGLGSHLLEGGMEVLRV